MKASDEVLKSNRRQFIQYTGAMIGGMAFQIGAVNPSFASGSNTLKVGLIGCGGRGAGAASQALAADPDTILTAMGDVFVDRLDESYAALLEMYPNRVKVAKDH
jgi:myo-inositol 2-dehydrogenase/D-chiro-inositol 1-dehydrogenase